MEECEAVGLWSYFKGRPEDLAMDCMRKFSKERSPGRLVGLRPWREETGSRSGWGEPRVLFAHVKLELKVWSSLEKFELETEV